MGDPLWAFAEFTAFHKRDAQVASCMSKFVAAGRVEPITQQSVRRHVRGVA
jgi:hypothetical protein